jgi:uncharacterized protein
MPVEMVIHSLGQAPSGMPLVLLKEDERDRYLLITIGPLEFQGIVGAFSDPPARPLTHDLLRRIMQACGARVTHAVIHSLIDGVYHARLVLDVQGRHVEIDSRASDAIAVTARVGIPVQVDEDVLALAAVFPQAAPGSPTTDQDNAEHISEEQLGVFCDVIRGLDLDSLGHVSQPRDERRRS